ncbi:MAG: DUF4358 domain-containing protein [Ruminococcaceae bacterium]|nr:DUF4358 domain-containing protein [Oscillospiraceae bacterium]
MASSFIPQYKHTTGDIMNKYRITEIICVVLVLLFIVNSVKGETLTEKSAEELSSSVISLMDDASLLQRSKSFIKEQFNIDISGFSSVSYYSSDDVMNVNELFIGVLSEDYDANISEVFSGYAKDRYNLYNGYANEQAAHLDNYVLSSQNGAVIFCVGKNADAVLNEFINNL